MPLPSECDRLFGRRGSNGFGCAGSRFRPLCGKRGSKEQSGEEQGRWWNRSCVSGHSSQKPPEWDEVCRGTPSKMKMRQAGVYACLIIRCFWLLVVKLQRKLDIARRLLSVDLAGGILIHGSVGSGQVDTVKGVQEVATELQFEAFR